MGRLVLIIWWASLLALGARAQQRGWRKGVWIAGAEAPEEAQAAWPDRPPMRGAAPRAHRTPVRPPPEGPTGWPRKAADLLAPLWAEPAHRFEREQNVVMGLALRYLIAAHRAFVGSLRRTGFRGDVVLATEPLATMQPRSAEYLRSMGVVAYPVVPVCAQATGSIKHKTCQWRDGEPPLPLAIIRHALYHAIALLYPEDAQFYVADYRDTFFQRDPFGALVADNHNNSSSLSTTTATTTTKTTTTTTTTTTSRGRDGRLRGLDLVVVAEHWPFKKLSNCPFNGGWVRNCWGREAHDEIRDSSVLCSGSYMGAQPAIVNFERTLLAAADDDRCHEKGVPSDQGYLNYLFHTGRLPARTVVEARGLGVVNTVGALDGSRPRAAGYLPATHVNLGQYWRMFDPQGFVLQDDARTRSAVVHQYDRFYIEFEKLIAKLGACDAPDCYDHHAALLDS